MTVREIHPSVGKSYEGLSSDVKPTGVVINSTFLEQDTQSLWITHDGTNWVLRDVKAMAGQAIGAMNVTTASTQIKAANSNRVALIIVNDSDTPLYLAIGQTAVLNQGIRLNTYGGVLILSRNGDVFSTEAVNGIHGGTGNKVATYQEFI